jgi:lipoprotein signal peptidase
MPALTNLTRISIENITAVGNMTTGDPVELFININQIVFGGWLVFILLICLWIILYFAAQDYKDLGLINFMYSGAVVSVVSFLFRAIYIYHGGLVWGLLNDWQMWLFPIVTILSAGLVWASKPAY